METMDNTPKTKNGFPLVDLTRNEYAPKVSYVCPICRKKTEMPTPNSHAELREQDLSCSDSCRRAYFSKKHILNFRLSLHRQDYELASFIFSISPWRLAMDDVLSEQTHERKNRVLERS